MKSGKIKRTHMAQSTQFKVVMAEAVYLAITNVCTQNSYRMSVPVLRMSTGLLLYAVMNEGRPNCSMSSQRRMILNRPIQGLGPSGSRGGGGGGEGAAACAGDLLLRLEWCPCEL